MRSRYPRRQLRVFLRTGSADACDQDADRRERRGVPARVRRAGRDAAAGPPARRTSSRASRSGSRSRTCSCTAGSSTLLFNMLALWMFGVELERMWGTRYFRSIYFVAGVGAAVTTLLLSLLPLAFADQLYYSLTIGASGAVYGVLLAYALYFPHRPIYMYFVFPIPAKYFVMIIGAISLLLVDGRTRRRRRAHHAPRRARRRLPVPEERAASHLIVGDQVPLPEVADQPDAPQVRRLLRRPGRRRQSARALTLRDSRFASHRHHRRPSAHRSCRSRRSVFAAPQPVLPDGLKTSSSNVSSSASAWWGTPDGMCSTSPSRTMISSPPTRNLQRALQDVGHLLALVRVHRHERAALEIDLRQHLALAGDDLLRDHLGDLFERDLVPAVQARHGGHTASR